MNNEQCPSHRFTHFLWALLGGAAAGATVVYLTTPRSGADSRQRLLDVTDTARDTANRFPIALRRATEAARDAFNETLREGADS